MPDSRARSPSSRLLASALVLLIAATVALASLRMARSFPRDAHLGYADGIWTALAIDTTHGVFYRPLEGPLGYGGTRYFPLFFMLHAGAIRLGLPPVVGGQMLAVASVGLLVAGIVLFLRRSGATWLTASTAAAVALACQPVQMALLSIRSDGLATALALAGLTACVGPTMPVAAPLLFVLAFATKPTSLYAPAGVFVLFMLVGRQRDAWRLTLVVGGGIAVVLAAMWLASGHRIFDILAASASGGTGWASLAHAPESFARILRRTPEVLLAVLVALSLALMRARRPWRLEVAAGLVCLPVTVAIFASPATIENHLIDLTVMAVLVVGGLVAREPASTRHAAILVVTGLVALAAASRRFGNEDGRDMRGPRLAALAAVADAPGPVLFEQPMLAAERGEPSYLLDGYIFSVRVKRDAAVMRRLLQDLDRRVFNAVVLEQASPDLWFTDLPPEEAEAFRRALAGRYGLQAVVEGRAIYRPR